MVIQTKVCTITDSFDQSEGALKNPRPYTWSERLEFDLLDFFYLKGSQTSNYFPKCVKGPHHT